MKKVIVEVHQGMVSRVFANDEEIEVLVIDTDVQTTDEDRLLSIEDIKDLTEGSIWSEVDCFSNASTVELTDVLDMNR